MPLPLLRVRSILSIWLQKSLTLQSLPGLAGDSIVAGITLVMGDFIIRRPLTNVLGRIQSFGGKQY